MDFISALQEEIKKKKNSVHGNTLSPSSKAQSTSKRWRSRADVEKEREEHYLANERAEADKRASKRQRLEVSRNSDSLLSSEADRGKGRPSKSSNVHEIRSGLDDALQQRKLGNPPLSKPEVARRLRGLKEPVTLFGEDDWERFNRLRNLDLERDDVSQGQKNVFQSKMRELQSKDAEDDVYRYTGAQMPQLKAKQNSDDASDAKLDSDLLESTCKEDYVHGEIRKYMRLWRAEIEAMSTEERRTNKGRKLIGIHEQTKEWLKPLEKLLRKRKLSQNILDALKEIFEATSKLEYVEANRLYLERLAIGNAPWPMGATMVGIHARAAREKIGEDKIAHVMNDEQTRKYVQAVKRLLTAAQRHFPTTHSRMIS